MAHHRQLQPAHEGVRFRGRVRVRVRIRVRVRVRAHPNPKLMKVSPDVFGVWASAMRRAPVRANPLTLTLTLT